MGTNFDRSYDDFEPFCQWQRGQGRDVLEIHLQGFKKEHLRVQINNYGVMTISGEQSTSNGKIKRFRKEIKVNNKDIKPPHIHAKFSGGILYIIMQYNSGNESTESQKNNEKKNSKITCYGNRIPKNMAVTIGVLLAVGTIVGGFLIAWKCSKLPPPIMY